MKNIRNIRKNKRSAFSLIELSIVLIIIGLLIAGITGGASLIKSSELRSVMGEARGFSVAVNAFFTQFDGLPGDYDTSLSSNDGVGDGDDIIEYVNALNRGEGLEAWRDLFVTGAVSEVVKYTTLTTAAAGIVPSVIPGSDIPSSKIKSAGWVFDSWDSDSQNVVVITGATTSTNPSTSNTLPANGQSAVFTGVIAPTDALSIDVKSDDGVPNTGVVRAIATSASTCFDNAASSYRVANSNKECAMSFSVDVNS